MRTIAISNTNYRKLLRRLHHPYDIACMLMYHTGLRIDDVCALHAPLSPTMQIVEQKTRKTRKIFIPLTVRKKIAQTYSIGYTGRVVPRHRTSVYRAIRQSGSSIGISCSPHSLRKTYARNYYNRYGLSATQSILQHDNISTTLLYLMGDVKP